MTTVQAAEATRSGEDNRRRYGNWRQLGFKLYGIGLLPGAAVFLTLVLAVFMIMVHQYLLMLGLVLLLAVEVPLLWPAPEGARYQRIGRWVAFRVLRRSKGNVLAQGPTGKTKDGLVRLPGLGASTQLSEHRTALGDAFALLSWPKSKSGMHTVVMQAHPTGTTGRDQSDIDRMVAHHGGLMKLAGEQGDVVGMACIVETAPDTGLRLKASTERGRSKDAPEYSQAVREGTLAKVTVGSPSVKGWTTFSFKGTEHGSTKKLPTQAVADDLATRLPHLLGEARLTGAGDTARWCDAQQVIDDTRSAYDPAAAFDIEKARLLGEGTGLAWTDAGPVHAQTEYTEYHHDGAVSRTWVWVRPPKAPETEDVMRALIAPHPHIPRKRVSIQYRPLAPEVSQDLAEQGVKETRFSWTQADKARHDANFQFAKKAEREENEGAVMVRTAVMITVTAFSDEELKRATTAVRQLAKRAHLTVRIANGMQDTGFMQTLPLGLVIPEFLNVPDNVRDQI
ncbi:SCO6880 family protein [Luteipulveratus halotolerans]|uniref:Integral membrane protein n=1 Tax=Luteipulveratus halotolerans TaxID=1631356 RepID=A0A0L6CPW8_9MICO|nr:SCO6880 family protein [Luteipulveratus halotolerans]KNX39700.1 hypothetical protein VV01_00240 [Luteipulveratus halotolerans]